MPNFLVQVREAGNNVQQHKRSSILEREGSFGGIYISGMGAFRHGDF
jgi:hypothetical protein